MQTDIQPRYRVGRRMTLLRRIKWILSGTQVSIIDSKLTDSGNYRYQVKSIEYTAPNAWVDEDDLGAAEREED